MLGSTPLKTPIAIRMVFSTPISHYNSVALVFSSKIYGVGN